MPAALEDLRRRLAAKEATVRAKQYDQAARQAAELSKKCLPSPFLQAAQRAEAEQRRAQLSRGLAALAEASSVAGGGEQGAATAGGGAGSGSGSGPSTRLAGPEDVRRVLRAASDYEVLQLPVGSTAAEVRRAYRRLAACLHPDKCREEGAQEAFIRAAAAYNGLLRRCGGDRSAIATNISTRNLIHQLDLVSVAPQQKAIRKPDTPDQCGGLPRKVCSGKTLAFVLPVIERLRRLEEALKTHQVGAIIISPTRELAKQIYGVAGPLIASVPGLTSMLLVGGTDPAQDVAAFKSRGAHVLVGTPGRIDDIVKRCTAMDLKRLEVLVLDEADRLLDLGFRAQLDSVMSRLPRQRRTGLFSATQTEAVQELARAGLRNPVLVNVAVTAVAAAAAAAAPQGAAGSGKKAKVGAAGGEVEGLEEAAAAGGGDGAVGLQKTPNSLSIQYVMCEADEKIPQLVRFLRLYGTNCKIIVYAMTCAVVDYLSLVLPRLPALRRVKMRALHGRMKQAARERELEAFRQLSAGALLATDLAARGLDIPDVHWVVQLDPPQDPAAFVHRVGRTARMGRQGSALAYLQPHEEPYLEFLRLRKIPITETSQLPPTSGRGEGGPQAAAASDPPRPEEQPHGHRNKKRKGQQQGQQQGAHVEEGKGGAGADRGEGRSLVKGGVGNGNATSGGSPNGRLVGEGSATATATDGGGGGDGVGDVVSWLRGAAEREREVMEGATRAFVTYVRAYKEHQCKFIFRLQDLNVGRLARGLGLLRLPKMPDVKKPLGLEHFTPSQVDPMTVPYKDKPREKQRLKAIEQRRAAAGAGGAPGGRGSGAAAKRKAPGGPDAGGSECRLPAAKRRQLQLIDEATNLNQEYSLLKKLKKGKITEHQYDVATGLSSDSDAEEEAAAAAGGAGKGRGGDEGGAGEGARENGIAGSPDSSDSDSDRDSSGGGGGGGDARGTGGRGPQAARNGGGGGGGGRASAVAFRRRARSVRGGAVSGGKGLGRGAGGPGHNGAIRRSTSRPLPAANAPTAEPSTNPSPPLPPPPALLLLRLLPTTDSGYGCRVQAGRQAGGPPKGLLQLGPPRLLAQELLQYGLRIDDINLTRALRRYRETSAAAATAAAGSGGGGSGSSNGGTGDEAAASGELLLPPPSAAGPGALATASPPDGRTQLLLLGSVQLVDAGEGQGVGAAGGSVGPYLIMKPAGRRRLREPQQEREVEGGGAVCGTVREADELWLTWRMEVAGVDKGGEVVKKIAVPGELSHLFRPGQRGWGVQGLLSASELDALLGCSRLRRIRPVSECEVMLASISPRVVLVDDFLPACLCDALRAVAEPRLIRSRVSTGAETPSRVSHSTFFTGDSARLAEVVAVEALIQQLLERTEVTGGGRPTLVKSEALQVVSYDVGGFYSEHYDNKAGGVISRAATVIIYLEDTPQGGATFFPKSTGLPSLDSLSRAMPALDAIPQLTYQLHAMRVARPGLRIYPAKGRAVIFWSRLVDGSEDLASLHAAEPVRAGSKWICTRWFKELAAT
ncbi:hypothetical protein VOLCADRAFT_108284 [Volvox carteri f. nagariensis]|uniref:ATP-dependent RNA helicase n=1 Tax=Volvox carteri f. nagariensis TaxID=3068 RepID=D8UJA2_VOLCA|nr:uncharacterized protein VOLCADRAFT_108284 [Volvox carteri f. nagariensis]EFJ40203.1 hypothetical protein VOLCADRAFT_108284 [Volvox carteri f. nagariensis]|eukprot:XP_002958747.1 hypothetical protein VOLCADRAFT_108284 [Volvox carteri f. nagariensis]